MSARIFGADEAKELGLLSRVVTADALDAAVEAEVTPYLACAPGAVAAAKDLALYLGTAIDQEVMDHTVAELRKRWDSKEGHDGIDAFFSKTKPSWVVRG